MGAHGNCPSGYELAEQFLKSAEELIEAKDAQETLLEVLDQAEGVEDVSVLCRSARLLFRYGVLNSKGRFDLMALDKLKLAEEKNPRFFETTTLWWQLWGNILIQLGKLLNDYGFFELALQKYQNAEKIVAEIPAELYWDAGEAWILLGRKSGEPFDFQKGLAYFQLAQQRGISSHFFHLDYGNALCQYSLIKGDPALVEESISFFRTIIAEGRRPPGTAGPGPSSSTCRPASERGLSRRTGPSPSAGLRRRRPIRPG